MFVVLLCFGLLGFEVFLAIRKARKNARYEEAGVSETPLSEEPERRKPKDSEAPESTKLQDSEPLKGSKSQSAFVNLVIDFHKAQCYFSGTLQIASLSYGIFDTST